MRTWRERGIGKNMRTWRKNEEMEGESIMAFVRKILTFAFWGNNSGSKKIKRKPYSWCQSFGMYVQVYVGAKCHELCENLNWLLKFFFAESESQCCNLCFENNLLSREVPISNLKSEILRLDQLDSFRSTNFHSNIRFWQFSFILADFKFLKIILTIHKIDYQRY